MMHDDLYDEIASQIKILTTREDIHRLVRRYEHEKCALPSSFDHAIF